MVAPIISIEDSNGTELNDMDNVNNLGIINAGGSSPEKTIKIINNKNGVSNVSPMTNVTLTTVTKSGYMSGDVVENGKEAVEGCWLKLKSNTDEDENFAGVGGTVTKSINDIRGSKLEIPGIVEGTISHVSGSKVPPGTYYAEVSAEDETGETAPGQESSAVIIAPMLVNTTEDNNSETLDATTITKIAQKFPASKEYMNGAFLKMANGGTLVGTLRIETDNSGSPSGTLVDPNLEVANINLTSNAIKNIFSLVEGILTNATDYWLVFAVTTGSGMLRGTTTGSTNTVKIFQSGSWVNSTLKTLVYGIISDNQIIWNWDEVEGAISYNLYRTTTSGTYIESSFLAGINTNSYTDSLENTGAGQPVEDSTVTYQHENEIIERLDIPTNATGGAVEMELRISYSYI